MTIVRDNELDETFYVTDEEKFVAVSAEPQRLFFLAYNIRPFALLSFHLREILR